MQKILGKWNASVILTYLAVGIALFGMYLLRSQTLALAMLCLIWSGVFDLLDGPLARSMQRTKEEERFGVQLDTLADVVNFLLFPILFAWQILPESFFTYLLTFLYLLAGLARLSDFTAEVEEQAVSAKERARQAYKGLPVTYAALIFPFLYLWHFFALPLFIPLLQVVFLAMAFAFVYPIRIVKPGKRGILSFGLLAIAMSILYLYLHFA